MKIPFSPPDITEAEIEQVAEALRSGWITTGPKTKELEREVADLCGTNRAVWESQQLQEPCLIIILQEFLWQMKCAL